mmetsp:Transcript_72304/g.192087  ORF Transcript_72304/g.192087 Transcript_72304/m.192087 type:complete len:205 (-) Transcript_72304:1940-2554(-)
MHRRLLQADVVVLSGLHKHLPLVSTDRDPALLAIRACSELAPLRAFARLIWRVRKNLESLPDINAADHRALLELLLLCHCDPLNALVELVADLGCQGALCVADVQPASSVFVASDALHAHVARLPVARPLNYFQHLARSYLPHYRAGLLGLLMQGKALPTPQERLLCPCEVRRPRLVLDSHPAHGAVLYCPALHPLHLEVRVLL